MRSNLHKLLMRACFTLALTILAVSVSQSSYAAPPTVVPSPGYDARLSEQRARAAAEPPAAAVAGRPVLRHVPVRKRHKPR